MIDEDAVRTLAHGDVGGWSRAGIEHLVNRLGWRIDDDASIDGFSVGFATGRPGSAGVNLSGGHDERFGFGECAGVYAQSPVSAQRLVEGYRAGLATITSVLGPPAMVSGPQAGALWRLPDRRVEFFGSSRGGPGTLGLSVEPRDAVESYDFHAAMRADDYDPPYRWAVLTETEGPVYDTVADLVVHGRRVARNWDELAAGVRAVFGSLAVDVPLLAPYLRRVMWRIGPRDDGPFVQGWFTADECHLEAPTADLTTTAKNGITGLTLDSGTEDTGERIAAVALGAIRTWGVASPADLTCRAWTTRAGSRLVLFGVGL